MDTRDAAVGRSAECGWHCRGRRMRRRARSDPDRAGLSKGARHRFRYPRRICRPSAPQRAGCRGRRSRYLRSGKRHLPRPGGQRVARCEGQHPAAWQDGLFGQHTLLHDDVVGARRCWNRRGDGRTEGARPRAEGGLLALHEATGERRLRRPLRIASLAERGSQRISATRRSETMAAQKACFGLTLPNRGVVIGATTVPEMLEMAEMAESAGWDSVWVGDSIFAKPRLDAIVLLGVLAARTKRVRLGPACFASTPLRNALTLAYQWASLDLVSGGRTIFVACQGQPGPGGGDFGPEFEIFGVEPSSRMRRMEEAIEIMRLTSSREHVDYDGQYNKFRDVTVLPRPVQQPLPIWVVSNPDLKKRRNAE